MKNTLQDILSRSKSGFITSAEITKAGFHRSVLQSLVESEALYQVDRGIYLKADCWEDEFYLAQIKYPTGIFDRETALYLHGMTDRTPAQLTMTFLQGYNPPSLKSENILPKRVIKDFYDMGRITGVSPAGNTINLYNIERTLCDLVRGKGSDIQIVNEAMKRYALSKTKDIHKLMQYAEKLRVRKKVQRYMEVLL